MEDKIEVNEYVRTDKGKIAKVISVAKETLLVLNYRRRFAFK